MWDEVVARCPDLTEAQLAQLLEACRCKDRLDRIDDGLADSSALWLEVPARDDGGDVTVVVDKAVSASVALQSSMQRNIAALRLPDARGVATGRPASSARVPYTGGSERTRQQRSAEERAAERERLRSVG